MEINFRNIKPHVRLARALTLEASSKFSGWIPYDARIFFVTEGSGLIETADGVYNMNVGDMLFINSGTEYRIVCNDKPIGYIFISFDYVFSAADENIPLCPDSPDKFAPSRMPAHITFTDATELNSTLHIINAESFIDIAKKIVYEFSHGDDMKEIRLSAAMADLIVLALRKHRTENRKKHQNADKILEYINASYHLPLINEQLAAKFHYHPNHLNSIIKAETGIPLREYIKNVRVKRAADMLLNTDKTVSEIALLCGFYDTPHFIRCFKSAMKTTPGRYRTGHI